MMNSFQELKIGLKLVERELSGAVGYSRQGLRNVLERLENGGKVNVKVLEDIVNLADSRINCLDTELKGITEKYNKDIEIMVGLKKKYERYLYEHKGKDYKENV